MRFPMRSYGDIHRVSMDISMWMSMEMSMEMSI